MRLPTSSFHPKPSSPTRLLRPKSGHISDPSSLCLHRISTICPKQLRLIHKQEFIDDIHAANIEIPPKLAHNPTEIQETNHRNSESRQMTYLSKNLEPRAYIKRAEEYGIGVGISSPPHRPYISPHEALRGTLAFCT
jgi:hypothetical protein